jgi:branched-chain amino acid transport system permease protein
MTQFIGALVSGLAIGGIVALLALGYVIVYRSTHTLNFAQGSMLVLGGYVTLWFSGPIKGATAKYPPTLFRFPFLLALVLAMVVLGVFGWLLDVTIVSRFRGRPVFAVIMATLGVATVLDALMSVVWGTLSLNLAVPNWTLESFRIRGVSIGKIDVFTLAVVLAISIAFFFGFQRSKLGTAMKATAFDQEAAIAQGISPKVIFGTSWALSAALAAIGGVLLACGAGSLETQTGTNLAKWAFLGFPAIVLGGVDSLEGAVIGGMIIGLVVSFAARYEANLLNVINVGHEFFNIAPFLLMIIILLVRPAGLLGTKEVRRV